MEVAHHYTSIVTMQGIDVGGQLYWSWEWDDGEGDFVVPDAAELAGLLAELDAGIPHLPSGTDGTATALLVSLKGSELYKRSGDFHQEVVEADTLMDPTQRLERLGSLAMVANAASGVLAEPTGERELAGRLGNLLLPKALTDRLRETKQLTGGIHVLVQVLPAPSCGQIPWELLGIDRSGRGDERLIDVADVVTMAPLLSRDGDTKLLHPSWSASASNPPVYLIDPLHGRGDSGVLSEAQAWDAWSTRVDRATVANREFAIQSYLATPQNVGSVLRADPPPSRFFYLGHVRADPGNATQTSVLVPDDRGLMRQFTALDWLVDFGAAQDPDPPPAAIRSGRWPMPPRAALIACASGTDFAHLEPFGLPTAILELGAELVTATRWTLLTDQGFALAGSTAQPLNDLALTIDELHDGPDPIHGLSEWQRGRLQDWRRAGTHGPPDLGDSPLTWASVTNFYAPDRTDSVNVRAGTPADSYDDAEVTSAER